MMPKHVYMCNGIVTATHHGYASGDNHKGQYGCEIGIAKQVSYHKEKDTEYQMDSEQESDHRRNEVEM